MRINHIVLVGFKHTGKSQHGRSVARELGYRFIDTDAIIQELDSTESGMRRPVRDIYAEDGRERFQQLETAACRLVMEIEEPVVAAAGGGLCDNREGLAALGGATFVHLVDSFEALSERILRGGIPAFLHTTDADEAKTRLRELYERRVGAYNAFADLVVEIHDLDLATARKRTLGAVRGLIGEDDGR